MGKNHNNGLLSTTRSTWQLSNLDYLDEILSTNFRDILGNYLPIKTVALILSCYQGYQAIVREVITCAHQLTYIKCDYWQELVFIWDGFITLHHKQSQIHKLPETTHAYSDVLQQFYLCHIRSFQNLLDPIWAINDFYRHKIALYLNKLRSAAYCHG